MTGRRFVLTILVAYAWLFPWLPALRSPNELSRLLQARAIVDDGALSLNRQMARWGAVGDLSICSGRYYPNKAPGASLLAAPVYAGLRLARGRPERVPERAAVFFIRLAICMVPGALAAEGLRRILARRFEPPLAAAGAIVVALGSLMWPYSTLLMSHGPTAAALVGCWYALDRARAQEGDRPLLFAIAGLAAGTAVLLEYTSALMLPPLAAYGLAAAPRRGRALLAGVAGALPPIVGLALYHWSAYGSPFDTGYAHLVNPAFAAIHARGFMGVSAPKIEVLGGSFLDPARGLFVYAPFLALGVPGIALLWCRDRPLAWLCGAALAIYSLFTASFDYHAWGWSVGPRHITALCPFLAPPAIATAEWLARRGLGIVPAALALYSIGVLALLAATSPYLPEGLSNPVHQLAIPLARSGFRAHDVLGMALGTASPWTLVPWAAVVAFVAYRAAGALLPPGARRLRTVALAGATALALLLFVGLGALGGVDRFEATRRFMVERWEPRPGGEVGLFAPP